MEITTVAPGWPAPWPVEARFAAAILRFLVFIPKSLQRTPWPTKRSLDSKEIATGVVIMRAAVEEAAAAAGLLVVAPVLRRAGRQKRARCLASWALYMQMGRCRVRHLSYYAPTLRRTGGGGSGGGKSWVERVKTGVMRAAPYLCFGLYLLALVHALNHDFGCITSPGSRSLY